MRGIVRIVRAMEALVVVETEYGEYTVLGLLDDSPIAEGDLVSGPLESRDQQRLVNETQGHDMLVYIEDAELSLEAAEAALP